MKLTRNQFAISPSKAFLAAEKGTDVTIEWYGKEYELKLIKKNYSSYALPEYKPDPKRMGKADPSIKVNNSDEPRVVEGGEPA